MSKLFALRSGFEELVNIFEAKYSSQIKQQALLFDSIGILRLEAVINALETVGTKKQKEKISHTLMELKWLIENQILFEPAPPSNNFEFLLETFGQDQANEYLKIDDEIKLLKEKGKSDQLSKEEIVKIFSALLLKDTMAIRLLSTSMKKDENFDIVTTLPEFNYAHKIPNSNKMNVIQVVINNMPLPDINTPWEQILDYKSDTENQKNLISLRRWIRKVSTEELSKAEVEDEIEWLINEFHGHMKYHKIKANTETLEVLIKAPLEIIENLVKLRLSKLPEPFFALKKMELTLMEAEINAPGKELAYLIKSRESFHSQK